MRFLIIALLIFTASCAKPEKFTKSKHVITISDVTFDENIKEGVVLVDFYATWCGPCKFQEPIVHKLADQYAGKVKVGKLDVDIGKSTASVYKIKSIPTIIIFVDGKEVKRFTGLAQKDELSKVLDQLVK